MRLDEIKSPSGIQPRKKFADLLKVVVFPVKVALVLGKVSVCPEKVVVEQGNVTDDPEKVVVEQGREKYNSYWFTSYLLLLRTRKADFEHKKFKNVNFFKTVRVWCPFAQCECAVAPEGSQFFIAHRPPPLRKSRNLECLLFPKAASLQTSSTC